jgi:hypothetical protein
VDRYRFDADPDSDPNFHFDDDPDPDPERHQNDADPLADPTSGLKYVRKSEFFTYWFILLVFQRRRLTGVNDIDPDRHTLDADLDPVKLYGFDLIRYRIQNTVWNQTKFINHFVKC